MGPRYIYCKMQYITFEIPFFSMGQGWGGWAAVGCGTAVGPPSLGPLKKMEFEVAVAAEKISYGQINTIAIYSVCTN